MYRSKVLNPSPLRNGKVMFLASPDIFDELFNHLGTVLSLFQPFLSVYCDVMGYGPLV